MAVRAESASTGPPQASTIRAPIASASISFSVNMSGGTSKPARSR
jgi:hypothetical protein